jgi:hypothetical protein
METITAESAAIQAWQAYKFLRNHYWENSYPMGKQGFLLLNAAYWASIPAIGTLVETADWDLEQAFLLGIATSLIEFGDIGIK